VKYPTDRRVIDRVLEARSGDTASAAPD